MIFKDMRGLPLAVGDLVVEPEGMCPGHGEKHDYLTVWEILELADPNAGYPRNGHHRLKIVASTGNYRSRNVGIEGEWFTCLDRPKSSPEKLSRCLKIDALPEVPSE